MTAPKYRGVRGASILYTGAGIRAKDGRHPVDADLGEIANGALVYDVASNEPTIVWIGDSNAIPAGYFAAEWVDLDGARAVMPSFTDAHTHLVFAGNRASEFARRCAGTTYAEIAKEGGGILTSVRATRDASEEALLSLARPRLDVSRGHGVAAIEIKSGYGLSLASELKVLRVIRRLREENPDLLISSTFLGAHDFPREVSRADYLKMLLEEALPEVARTGLADACDVFIDEGFYTLGEGEQILDRARSLGLRTKVHADELANTESSALAARIGALSADHLLKISDAGISALAASQTVGVVLPGTAFYLKAAHAPARRMIDAGVKLAIATDFNPGTCHSLNLPLMLTISALYQGLSRAELYAAVTFNAASALGLEDRIGTLEVGRPSRFQVLPVATFEEVYYRF